MINLKDYVKTLPEKPVLVFGLGMTGMSLVKALQKGGAQVVVGDDHEETRLHMQKRAGVEGLEDYDVDFSQFSLLLLSPGVPLSHPEPHRVVVGARKAGVEIIGDIELFHRALPACKTIGVTGTNGKSTVATLIHHILMMAHRKAELGGNIGKPVFDLELRDKDAVAVLELSSFQIDLCPTFRPDISVILNVTPDHLDRHGDMETYAAVKGRLIEAKEGGAGGSLVIAVDDDYTQTMANRAAEEGLRAITLVSAERVTSRGIYVQEGILYDAMGDVVLEAVNLADIPTLRGVHNHQNAACAYGAARAAGLAMEEIVSAMRTYPGLQHRQFLVRTINGVEYVNDSKATNAAAAAMALACRSNIYWIVGGRKKKTGLEGLERFFPVIKHAFLIGEATEDFAAWFENYGIPFSRCHELKNAVAQAHKMAQDNRGQPGGAGCVLLSPACASLDQFISYEHRGSMFESHVAELDEGI